MKRNMMKLNAAAFAAIATALCGSANAVVVISDSFSINPSRAIASSVIGSNVEVGGKTWIHNGLDVSSPIIASSPNGGAAIAQGSPGAPVSYSTIVDLAGISSTQTAVQADLNPANSGWSAIIFSDTGGSMWNSSLMMLIDPVGKFSLYANHTSTFLTEAYAPTFHVGALNQLKMSYDSGGNTLTAWVNSVKVVDALTLGSYTPGLNYAGLTVNGASHANGPTMDNFMVSIADPPGEQPTWAVSTSGDWNVASNWSTGVVPNGVGAEARMYGAIGSSKSVYADSSITLGTLRVNNANAYVIGGAGDLTLDGGGSSALVDVQSGSHKINLPLTIASDTTLSVVEGSTLKISDPVTIISGKNLSQSGSGAVVYESTITVQPAASVTMASSTHARALTLQGVSNATVATHSGATPTVLQLDELNIDAGSKLDLKNNGLLVSSSASAVRAMIKSGAIDSTLATATQDLGYIDAGSGKIAVGYTLLGDLDLNGQVTSTDFNAFVAGYGLTSGAHWANGDVNYDDKVNTLDFNSLAGNFGGALSAAPALGSVVPEPATGALLILGAAGLIRRRR